MKYAIIVFITFAPLLPSPILADDLQVHDDYLPKYGDFYRPRDGTLQNYLVKIRDEEHYAMVYSNYINKIMDEIGRFDNEFYITLKAEYETTQGKEQKD